MNPQEWSKAVIQRDVACVDCGAKAPLHAHHVKPKATHPELRFDVSNGVAVCPACHWKRHEGQRVPRSRAKKRAPHRKTLELKLAYYMQAQPRAGERIADLEAEVRRLNAEIVRLRIKLATKASASLQSGSALTGA